MQNDQMFMAELGVMRKLSHPYIARYLGCGMMAGAPQEAGAEEPHSYLAIVRPPHEWTLTLYHRSEHLEIWSNNSELLYVLEHN